MKVKSFMLIIIIVITIWFVIPKKITIKDDYKNYHPKVFEPTDCIKKYPNESPQQWKIICAKAPFINNMEIEKDVEKALLEVGFLCAGFPYPRAEKVNSICEDFNYFDFD